MKKLGPMPCIWSKPVTMVQAFLIYIFLTNLQMTDSYFSGYAICAVTGILCLYDNYLKQPQLTRYQKIWLYTAAALFGLACVLANYALFKPITALMYAMNAALTFLGGMVVCGNVLACALHRLPLILDTAQRKHPRRLFWFVFASVVVVDVIYLIFALYPGVLTTDSVTTVAQAIKGKYNNTMPFYHTITFELFFNIGLWIFGNVTAAVAFFHFVQILFLAFCFGYALMTLYQIGIPKIWLGGFYLVYVLGFYNIVYSVTLWKDVPFAAAGLLLVTGLYRLLRNVGGKRWNYIVFTIGALGLSLWRTNGWYAFLAAWVVMFFLMRKRHKTLLILMAVVLVFCWILINPVLDTLEVSPTNMVEAFAVPFQQIARVVWNDRPLTDSQRELLSTAFNLELVKELYTPYTVDPIKFETFYYHNVPLIKENFGDYLKLYLELALEYPGDYLEAWIEETRGYWNTGYLHWIYERGAGGKEYGVIMGERHPLISALYLALFRYQEKPALLQPIQSVGFQIWVLLACFVVNAMKKREEFLMAIPMLVLVVGLWLGTPVFADFRYAYPVFLTVPVILATTLYHRDGA